MKNYTITQIKSSIGVEPRQKLYLKSLGLRKIGSTVVTPKTPSSEGLVKKVLHLVKVQETA